MIRLTIVLFISTLTFVVATGGHLVAITARRLLFINCISIKTARSSRPPCATVCELCRGDYSRCTRARFEDDRAIKPANAVSKVDASTRWQWDITRISTRCEWRRRSRTEMSAARAATWTIIIRWSATTWAARRLTGTRVGGRRKLVGTVRWAYFLLSLLWSTAAKRCIIFQESMRFYNRGCYGLNKKAALLLRSIIFSRIYTRSK